MKFSARNTPGIRLAGSKTITAPKVKLFSKSLYLPRTKLYTFAAALCIPIISPFFILDAITIDISFYYFLFFFFKAEFDSVEIASIITIHLAAN